MLKKESFVSKQHINYTLNMTTEQLILAAAEKEFLQKGYDGARTTSIAKEAGVTHAMLHYYFRTKDLLFERIVDRCVGTLAQSMVAILGDPNKPLLDRIESGISAHFDVIAANPLLPKFFITEVITRPERHHILLEKVSNVAVLLFSKLQQDLDMAFERGEIVKTDIRMLLISIISINVMPFIALPLIGQVMSDLTGNKEDFYAKRKAENVELILKRIKP